MSRTRVLIIVENLPVPFDRRVWLEATTLRDAGYIVSVICPQAEGFTSPFEVIDDIHVYRHPLPPDVSSVSGYLREYSVALYHQFKLVRRVRRERGFDVMHICNPPDLMFLVAAPQKLFRGVRVVFDQHDLNPEMYLAKYGRKDPFYYALILVERLTYAIADRVIVTNESYGEIATTRGGQRSEIVSVVRSGPELCRFERVPANDQHRRSKRFLVGYVGVMGEPEGIDYLLRGVRYLVHECGRRDIHFVLIGGGPLVEELKGLTRKLDLEECVEFTGRVSDQRLLELLSSVDVCVDPGPKTPFNDRSTMNKILEYMALGKPIVQFDLTEGRRSAGDASLYATPNDERDLADKLVELLESPQRRGEMGHIGLERMRTSLSWQFQAPRLLSTYAALLGGDGSRRRVRSGDGEAGTDRVKSPVHHLDPGRSEAGPLERSQSE